MYAVAATLIGMVLITDRHCYRQPTMRRPDKTRLEFARGTRPRFRGKTTETLADDFSRRAAIGPTLVARRSS